MHVFKAALIAGALTISGSAMAQNFQIGPDGIRVDRDRQERNFRGDREMRGEISQREAVNIAPPGCGRGGACSHQPQLLHD